MGFLETMSCRIPKCTQPQLSYDVLCWQHMSKIISLINTEEPIRYYLYQSTYKAYIQCLLNMNKG